VASGSLRSLRLGKALVERATGAEVKGGEKEKGPRPRVMIILRCAAIVATVLLLVSGAYLYWFAETSSVRIVIDNQTTDPMTVRIYVDFKEYNHPTDDQWNPSDSGSFDFDETCPLTWGSHDIVVEALPRLSLWDGWSPPYPSYSFTVDVGFFETESISLKLVHFGGEAPRWSLQPNI
jgi:hypothetical protein